MVKWAAALAVAAALASPAWAAGGSRANQDSASFSRIWAAATSWLSLGWERLVALPMSDHGSMMDPNGSTANSDFGPATDPNGSPSNSDFGSMIDPNGSPSNSDFGSAIDPNG
jgi:hypothetical protein